MSDRTERPATGPNRERDGRPTRRTDASSDGEEPPIGSRLFTYVVPFVAALFLALGIAGAVTGSWALVQPAIDGCDRPAIGVDTVEETDERLATSTPALETLTLDDLTDAEQRAFEEALEDVHREGTVDGETANLAAFERGVLVSDGEDERYVTLVSASRCLSVDPLVLPLGVVSLLVGLGGFVVVAFLNYPESFSPRLRWPPR
ncbi:hypothetical protein [Natronobiforma cellulositropha]|uniref:hypothetical protein n=1 Tax=Natronobiforma cellulositropha TaxID=1679076 RepID=UPI0021D5B272|nr:hypothetical protein [Natronobiforma cellulositropha]